MRLAQSTLHAPGPVDSRQSPAPFALTTLGQMNAESSAAPAEAAAKAGAAEQPPTEGAGAGADRPPSVAEPDAVPDLQTLFPPLPQPPPPPLRDQCPVSFSLKLSVKTRNMTFDTHAELDNRWYITDQAEKPEKRMRTA